MRGDLPSGYKPFDKELHDKWGWAEMVAMEKIKIPNYLLRKRDDEYKIDINVMKENEQIGGIEVEGRDIKTWRNEFPFETVHFLGRKSKYIAPNNFYVLINKYNQDKAIMIGFQELLHHEKQIMSNAFCVDEPIWDIPLEYCIFGWDEINACLDLFFNEELGSSVKLSGFMR